MRSRRQRLLLGVSVAALAAAAGPEVDEILLEDADRLLLNTDLIVELNTSVPAQSAAGTLDGTEWLVIVQAGTTKRVALSTVEAYING